jgi:hypothetical protein
VVSEVGISTRVIPDDTTVLPQFELAADCDESPFLDHQDLAARPKEREYVQFLESALDQIETAIEGLPRIEETGKELSLRVSRRDFRHLESVFTRQWRLIWPILVGAVARGEFSYENGDSPPDPATWPIILDRLARSDESILTVVIPAEGAPRKQLPAGLEDSKESEEGGTSGSSSTKIIAPTVSINEIVESSADGLRIRPPGLDEVIIDKDGDLIIPLSGPRNMLFTWQGIPAKETELRSFATRTAAAFLTKDVNDLLALSQFLIDVGETYRSSLNSLQLKLTKERMQFERLVVRGTVANRGGSPFSITNWARVFVQLEGHSYTTSDSEGRPSLKPYPRDEYIDVRIAEDRGEGSESFESPILVQPGSVVRFVAASGTPIRNLSYAEVLIKAMDGGDRKCYVGINGAIPGQRYAALAAQRDQLGFYYSKEQPFRDYRANPTIPPKT